MPHVFVNRARLFGGSGIPETVKELMTGYFWEAANAICYIIGGLLLTAGSILFLPEYEDVQNIGAWIFIAASIIYITVSVHDMFEILYQGKTLKRGAAVDIAAALCYTIGALNFILGSVFFLPNVQLEKAGAINFIMGSILFVIGAVINTIQIFDSPTRMTALYANVVAVCFVIGSTAYAAASVPYLFELDTSRDNTVVFRYAAVLYIIGSILFTIAGCFNMYRATLVMVHSRERMEDAESGNESEQLEEIGRPSNTDSASDSKEN